MSEQAQSTVAAFGYEWSQLRVVESRRSLYRKLFTSRGVWFDFYDNKVVADVGSGNGRFAWALASMTKAREILSIELSADAVEHQRRTLANPRMQIMQGDAAQVKFKADVIYAAGFIQHTKDPRATLANLVDNLNEGGELLCSFYMRSPGSLALRPLRWVLSPLSMNVLWALTPVLAPLFMVHQVGREGGYHNARHTAFDWLAGHGYPHYFTKTAIREACLSAGSTSTTSFA